MANSLYDLGRESFLTAAFSWTVATFKIYLIDSGAYTFSAAHNHLDQVAGASRIAGPVTLASMTATGGAADAADVTFTAVTGVSCEALLIYQHTGTESTSVLIAYIDTATGLPITPNGGDIIVQWDNGSNRIFRI